ncbi:unnamed protein product, partial [Fusarium langsethiae]
LSRLLLERLEPPSFQSQICLSFLFLSSLSAFSIAHDFIERCLRSLHVASPVVAAYAQVSIMCPGVLSAFLLVYRFQCHECQTSGRALRLLDPGSGQPRLGLSCLCSLSTTSQMEMVSSSPTMFDP